MVNPTDINHMKSALNMAGRGHGRTADNPSVGCVIVKDEIIIARARTADGGRPHAEVIALNDAGEQARGATLYVTLEPCAHHGNTPPCVDAVISAGIKRVVIGMIDIDLRTAGKSIEKLIGAGIGVTQGVLESECRESNAGFISRIINNRPYITIKTACTLDGKTALASGESKWITGELARKHVHHIRSHNDAILIGSGTALADDPMLSSRVDGVDHAPMRIVLDTNLRINLDSKLVSSANKLPLLVFCDVEENHEKYILLQKAGVILSKVHPYNLVSVLDILAGRGINRLLVEGGSNVHASFLCAGLCDELLIYRAPTLLGAKSVSAFGDIGIEELIDRKDFNLYSTLNLNGDVLETYKKKNES